MKFNKCTTKSEFAEWSGITKTVWSYETGTAGMLWQGWYGEQAATQGPTGDIFTVPGTGPWGLNGHINGAPSETGTHPDFNFTDIALAGQTNASLGTDQWVAYGFLKIPEGGGFIVEHNRNNGETGRVFLGIKDGCCNSRMELIVDQNVNTGAQPAGLLVDPFPVDGGECPVYFEMSDLSFFSGGQFQFSTEPEGTYVDIDVCQERGKWVCREEPCDYVLVEGETLKPPVPCCPNPYLAASGGGESLSEEDILALTGSHLELSNDVPIPDNDSQEFKRSGWQGDGTTASRWNHSHAIMRLANPGDPVPTFTGVGALNANTILDRWSDEESYEWAFRAQLSQEAGTGWGYIVIPNIAGFQRPIITVEGSYRSTSTAVQIDTDVINNQGGDGAGPRGPYMGQEVHHWSSTQRIYLGYFRRDNDLGTMWIDYRIKYICL